MDTYHLLFSDVQQSSGLLQQTRESDDRRKVLSSLDELQEKGVLLRYTAQDIKDGRKVADVKYTVIAAPDFIREQKAANKRASQNLTVTIQLRQPRHRWVSLECQDEGVEDVVRRFV